MRLKFDDLNSFGSNKWYINPKRMKRGPKKN